MKLKILYAATVLFVFLMSLVVIETRREFNSKVNKLSEMVEQQNLINDDIRNTRVEFDKEFNDVQTTLKRIEEEYDRFDEHVHQLEQQIQ